MDTQTNKQIENLIRIVSKEKNSLLDKKLADNAHVMFHNVDNEKIKNCMAMLSYDIKQSYASSSKKDQKKIVTLLYEIEESLLALQVSMDIYKNDVDKSKIKGSVKQHYKDFKILMKKLTKKLNKYIFIQEDRDEKSIQYSLSEENYQLLINLLFKLNYDIDEAGHDGNTILQMSCSIGNEEIVKYLIDYSADTDIQNNDGETALHMATKENYINILELLIDSEADMEKEDNNGKTALYIAVECNHKEIVKVLLENGADADTYDKNEQTVVQLASQNRDENIVNILTNYGATV